MELKEGNLLAFALLFGAVLLASFVSAEICSSPNDVIFKLSDTSNAHVGTWGSSYNTQLCYSSFFGAYSGDISSVHNCAGKSSIIWLNGMSNAHARDTSSSTFNTEVCYGDLECTVDTTSGNSCSDGMSTVVARFMNGYSSGTGTHMGISSTTYPNKLCCMQIAQPGGGGYKWQNSNNVSINTARVGDTIYAAASNYDGTPDSTFDIYENDPLFDDSIFSNVAGTAWGNDWKYSWLISLSDVQQSESGDYDEFRFDINGQTSPNLAITFCGDGNLDSSYGEECDVPGDSCTPNYGVSCSFCNSSCQEEFVAAPYCGDGILYSAEEECDLGTGNTNTCEFGAGEDSCNFCSSTTCDNVTLNRNEVYWTDLAGGIIETTRLGNLVRLYYPGGAGQTTDNFHIFEDDGLLANDDIRDVQGNNEGSDYVGFWRIDKTDLDAAADAFDPDYEFKFTINEKTSGELNVVEEGIETNSPVSLHLDSPQCGSVYYVGQNVTIEFGASDSDDLLSYSLTVGGTEIFSRTNTAGIGNRELNYTLSLQDAGTLEIRLYARSERNGVVDEASIISNIIVVDSAQTDVDYLASCISEPSNFQFITDEFVYFNASTSRAVHYDGTSTSDYSLSDLSFNWEFSDGRTNPHTAGTDSTSYLFYKYFRTHGKNWAELSIGLLS